MMTLHLVSEGVLEVLMRVNLGVMLVMRGKIGLMLLMLDLQIESQQYICDFEMMCECV